MKKLLTLLSIVFLFSCSSHYPKEAERGRIGNWQIYVDRIVDGDTLYYYSPTQGKGIGYYSTENLSRFFK